MITDKPMALYIIWIAQGKFLPWAIVIKTGIGAATGVWPSKGLVIPIA